MKNAAQRLLGPALLALMSVAMAVPAGCAHEPPILNDVVTCAGQTVQPTDVQEAYTDLTTQNWTDLVTEGVRLGWGTITCIIDQLSAAHPELKPSATKFKADHAAEIRSAGATSLRAPSLEKLATSSNAPPPAASAASSESTIRGSTADGNPGVMTRAGDRFAYAGENVGLTAARCDARCGGKNRGMPSAESSCQCWVGRGRNAHWQAAR